MHVVLETPAGGAADVELRLSTEDATVEDLLAAIGGGAGARGVLIDGRFCHLDLALTEIGLYEGARVRPADGAAGGPDDRTPPSLELRVIAGLDAGRRVALSPAAITVGRDEECELSLLDDGVSRRHFTVAATPSGLHATVTDLDSANGTWLEGKRISEPAETEPGAVVEAGDVAFNVAAPGTPLPLDPVRQASLAGTMAFNRPPRALSTSSSGPIEVPTEPGEGQKARFSIASAVGPLLMGGVMVVLLHNIIYALFMLLSPILVLGNYLEQRRQNKRSSRGDQRSFREALDRFRVEVSSRRSAERDRLRAAFPDLAEIVRRATAPDPRLWERRPDHEDFLHLSAGYGEVPFRPEVTDNWQATQAAELILAEHGWLELAPIDVDLSGGGVVGIVGDRAPSLALARALVCQTAVLHGPADLAIATLAEDTSGGDWDWVKWLPHARRTGGRSGSGLAVGAAAATALAAELTDGDPDDPRTTLAVLDIPALIEGRGAAGRALLRAGERVSGIVLARTTERLPAACTTVIELDEEAGEAVLSRPQLGQRIDPLLVAGLSERTARACALALARFEDADLQIPGGSLPDFVPLPGLIGLPAPDGELIRSRWAVTEHATELIARFAVAEDGPLDIDLVGDGPHGLIAGTTGAGKSELLRSLVASLAAAHGPARVNFVLVDYKGGSAFAECAELPHTVGMVTDLDEHLGERALLSLEAELRYRERVLRAHRTADIIEHDRLVAAGQVQALPRLVVIIDEFATLAAELPDFIASLVGIAQRGRSLGVHMILATQRPAGAVNENIRANTNLRICLRVQTPQDSSDVIDDPAAARIPRTQPGRAQVRLGPSELVPAQTALVSGASADGPVSAVTVVPFAPGREGAAGGARSGPAGAAGAPNGDGSGAVSDLARLVAAAEDAAAGSPPARRPWLEPLGEDVDLDRVLALGPPRPIAGDPTPPAPVVCLGLADDPGAQAQYPIGWNPSAGNLLLYGIGGSGTTTAPQTIALGLARTTDAARVHVYAMDFGAGELSALAALAGVGAVTTAAEHERQSRLLRRLRGELAVRRSLDPAGRAAAPRIVLLLDGYAGFASEHGDLAGDALREALARVWADGPELGMHTVIAADRLGAVPTALASLSQQRIAFQLADIADYAQFGLSRRAIPRFSPGRAVIGGTGQVVQFARVRDVAAAIGELGTGAAPSMAEGGPPPVAVLPESVPVEALLGGGRMSREPLFIPIGIGDETLEPVGFELYEGEHALVTGPPRTGRTTTLLVIAEVIARSYPGVELAGIAVRRGSRLREFPQLARVATSAEEIADLIAELRASERMQVLLIDDADATEDPQRALSELFSAGAAGGHIHAVIAGRADELRSLGHWSVGARKSRVGLLIQPDLQTDGMLLGVTLPRRPAPPTRPGCGYRVDAGGFELMQVAVA
jgi:S-DNA-T family DNA segregation ATPase FtsK/SpoIIIE